jgi:hypothetical protein
VWPMAMLLRLMPLMARSAKTTEMHKQELLDDIKKNEASDAVRVSSAYLDYIAADPDPAARLAASGNPAWVVHAEKGDGGLTDAERATLQAAPNVTLVTIPGFGVLPAGRGSSADRRRHRRRFDADDLTDDSWSRAGLPGQVDKRNDMAAVAAL